MTSGRIVYSNQNNNKSLSEGLYTKRYYHKLGNNFVIISINIKIKKINNMLIVNDISSTNIINKNWYNNDSTKLIKM